MYRRFIGSASKFIICLPLVFSIAISSGCATKGQPEKTENSTTAKTQTKTESTSKTAESETAKTSTAASSIKPINLDEMDTYENASLGIKVNYPKAWVKKNAENNKYIIAFESPEQGVGDYKEDMLISVDDANNDTLESIAKETVADLKDLPDFKVVKSETFKQGGIPVKKIVYTFPYNQRNIVMYAIIAIKNNKCYEVTLTAAATEYEDVYKELFDKIAGSWEIK